MFIENNKDSYYACHCDKCNELSGVHFVPIRTKETINGVSFVYDYDIALCNDCDRILESSIVDVLKSSKRYYAYIKEVAFRLYAKMISKEEFDLIEDSIKQDVYKLYKNRYGVDYVSNQ